MLPDLGGLRALLTGRGVHLGSLPAVLASRYGDRIAIEDDAATPGLHEGGSRSYDDLEAHAGLLASALAHLGVSEGQRVLVVVDNRVDIALHVFAVARLGAVAVPVNPRLTATEVAAIADASGADAAICDPETIDLAGDAVATVIPTQRLSDLVAAGALARLPAVGRSVSDPVLMLATSGTTGTPKAAVLTSQGLLAATGRLLAAPVGHRRGPRGDRDLVLAALPLTHVMGLQVLLGSLCAGVTLLHRSRFDADEVLDLVEERRPNVVIGVPTMYADLEAAGADMRDLRSVQVWAASADAMPPRRARRFQARGRAVAGRFGSAAFVDIYGMVELSGPAAVRLYPPAPLPTVALPVVGVVLPGLQVRVVDEDGDTVLPGRTGELQFRGPGVLRGYEGTSAGPDDDGWFATGDHGRLWPGNVFSLSGRDRDRLKVGGFSVFPAEIEAELAGAPGVRDLAVVGLPDERLGERPVALVVPDGDFDADAFLAHARQAVAGYRRPGTVVTVPEIPRGNHGKVARDAATQLARARTEAM